MFFLLPLFHQRLVHPHQRPLAKKLTFRIFHVIQYSPGGGFKPFTITVNDFTSTVTVATGFGVKFITYIVRNFLDKFAGLDRNQLLEQIVVPAHEKDKATYLYDKQHREYTTQVVSSARVPAQQVRPNERQWCVSRVGTSRERSGRRALWRSACKHSSAMQASLLIRVTVTELRGRLHLQTEEERLFFIIVFRQVRGAVRTLH